MTFNHFLSIIFLIFSSCSSSDIEPQVSSSDNPTPAENNIKSDKPKGLWDEPVSLSVAGVAGSVLPSGKVIYLQDPKEFGGSALVAFDPKNPSQAKYLSNIPSDFSAGLVQLSNGNLLVSGGENEEDESLKNVGIFDYQSETYSAASSMNHGRWNPTTLISGDGRVYAFGGQSEPGGGLEGNDNSIEIYDPSADTWAFAPGESMPGQYEEAFSRIHLMPDGKFFFSGHLVSSYLYDPTMGAWSFLADTNLGKDRGESGSVRLQNGEILIMGGTDMVNETGETYQTAEKISIEGSGQWTQVSSMNRSRAFFDAVILPDGNVFVVGGENSGSDGLVPELYIPNEDKWLDMAPHKLRREDHATALLLPDARVIISGGAGSTENPTGLYDETGNYEIWNPYYLYSTARPVISQLPETAGYGQQVTLDYTSEVPVQKVVLHKSGSATHGFTFNHISVPVALEENDGASATFTINQNSNLLPPGFYMVFLLSEDGVPSEASWMRIIQ